jgi:hypothetical protein
VLVFVKVLMTCIEAMLPRNAIVGAKAESVHAVETEHTRIRREATYQDAQCILVLVSIIVLNVPKFCSPRPALLEGECQFVRFTTALVSGSRQAFLNAMLLPGPGFPRGFTAHIKLILKLNLQSQPAVLWGQRLTPGLAMTCM